MQYFPFSSILAKKISISNVIINKAPKLSLNWQFNFYKMDIKMQLKIREFKKKQIANDDTLIFSAAEK